MAVFYTYFICSLLSVATMVYYAFSTRGHFYPSVLYLVSSKVALVVGGNMVVAMAIIIGQLLVKIFFDVLKEAEIELLIELLKYEAMETVFAFALFRNEISPQVVLFFLGVLFLKAFHLIAKTRVQYLEQVMPVSTSTHVRLQAVLVTLFVADLGIAHYCVQSTLSSNSTILILFGFEFGLLVISAFNTMTKYYLHLLDSYLSRGLVSKGLYIMILEVLCDAFRLVTYVLFFCLIYSYYGLPLHILREVWVSFVMFQRRLVGFIKYLKLIQNLETKFASATAEEIAAAGDCLVCREPIDSGKKLTCGHVFHVDCLRMWLQHQQTCPLCRADIPVGGVGAHRAGVVEEPNDAGDAAALRAVQNVIQAEAAVAAAAPDLTPNADVVNAPEPPRQLPDVDADVGVEQPDRVAVVSAEPEENVKPETSACMEKESTTAASTAPVTGTPLNAKEAARARWSNVKLVETSMAAAVRTTSPGPVAACTDELTKESPSFSSGGGGGVVEEFGETFNGDIVIGSLTGSTNDTGDVSVSPPVVENESSSSPPQPPVVLRVKEERPVALSDADDGAVERELIALLVRASATQQPLAPVVPLVNQYAALTLPRFVVLTPRANSEPVANPVVSVYESAGEGPLDELPIVRTFSNRKTVVFARGYSRVHPCGGGAGDRLWLQIVDGYILLPSDGDVAAGAHDYTVTSYNPVETVTGLQSQEEYKHQYLKQMSKLLPSSTRLEPPRSAGDVGAGSRTFDAGGGSGRNVSNDALLEHIKFLHNHVTTLTTGMEQLQQQLALTQLINKQLVSITQQQQMEAVKDK